MKIIWQVPFLLVILFAGARVYTSCGIRLDRCVYEDNSFLKGWGSDFFGDFRTKATKIARKYLPSPHSELLLGITLGMNDLKKIPTFNDVLRGVGTIHVVVVSGYNISLVFSLIVALIGSQYQFKNLAIAQIVTFFYALLSGFEPPVIRAWIMGSIIAWGKYYGRGLGALKVLIFSVLVMLLINPGFLLSLSFQLSFLATLSLVLYSDLFTSLLRFLPESTLKTDLIATLSAQVLVWPLISHVFGTVSVVSPLVNALTLWTIPLSTIVGGALLLGSFVISLPRVVWYLVYAPLDIFVLICEFFSKSSYAVFDLKISTPLFGLYYVLVLGCGFFCRKKQV